MCQQVLNKHFFSFSSLLIVVISDYKSGYPDKSISLVNDATNHHSMRTSASRPKGVCSDCTGVSRGLQVCRSLRFSSSARADDVPLDAALPAVLRDTPAKCEVNAYYTYTHAHAHTRTHTCTHAYTHIHTYCTYTHTHI